MGGFLEDSYNHINATMLKKVQPLLEQMQNQLDPYLPGCVKEIKIYPSTHEWSVEIESTSKYGGIAKAKDTKIKKILSYTGKFPVFYKGLKLFEVEVKQELDSGGTQVRTYISNSWELLACVNETACPLCKKLRQHCGCPAQGDPEYFVEISNLFKKSLSKENGPSILEDGAMMPTKQEPKLTQDDFDSIVGTMSKQLGTPKNRMKSIVTKITQSNPDFGFHEVVDAIIRGVK